MAEKGLACAAITPATLDKEITRTLEPRDPHPPPFITGPEIERIPTPLTGDAGGTARTLQHQWERMTHTPLSRNSVKEYLKGVAFRCKRCRSSLKDKRDAAAFQRPKDIVASLENTTQAGQCDLPY